MGRVKDAAYKAGLLPPYTNPVRQPAVHVIEHAENFPTSSDDDGKELVLDEKGEKVLKEYLNT